MTMSILGWLLILSSVAVAALLFVPVRARGPKTQRLDLDACKACLEDIAARLKRGALSESEADAARLALLSRSAASGWSTTGALQRLPQSAIVAAAAFLLVAGFGAARSNSAATGTTVAAASGSDLELVRLKDYARSEATGDAPSDASARTLLPDVSTMVERLAARLRASPNDVKGWRMLGWSYAQTGQYAQAATAFGRALELEPGSAELKSAFEGAKAKSDGNTAQSAAPDQQVTTAKADGASEAAAPLVRDQDAAIRSMVDGLAARLEQSPRDVEGWASLMRSRVVLGEKDAAVTALRKAREVFADDVDATNRIAAAATDLGLSAE